MESLAAFPAGGEWDCSFNRMYEELEFTQQVLQQFSFPGDEGLSFMNPVVAFCPNPEANMSTISEINESNLLYSPNALHDSNFHYNSQESSQSSNSSGSVFVSPPIHDQAYFHSNDHVAATTDHMMTMDISMDIAAGGEAFPNIAMALNNVIEDSSTDSLGNSDISQPAANIVLADELLLKRKLQVLELHAQGDDHTMINNNNSSDNSKKRPRLPKNAPRKKNRKMNVNGNEGENNIGSDGQSSSTCSSEDEIVSQDNINGSDSKSSPALNLNGKTRATRGSATDPQSLYARKRRERINERLRILQNLVPNGTKVDISTMLEEAVHYVKFLQLQIKLLSSDDLWMYAPIAYNGVDVGLNRKISTLL
ncbi:hypothetical protein CCACVL1_21742 [Corchorus capsularis]|uniref:BHLH domain-containing protein n=1 Tax=Corchorus capsularis TaxID=210143 RepID=A0A1R3H269_COCAP|nr:hypothetical protein CCACVL1_21742 [Corchorus capsularis]